MYINGFEIEDPTPAVQALMDEIETLKLRIRELELENADLKKNEKPLTWNCPEYYISNGTKAGAIEIYFESIPGTGIMKALRDNFKARWNAKKKCWYCFASAGDVNYILSGGMA